MLTGPPLRRIDPSSAAPGKLQVAVGLTLAHAFPLRRRSRLAVEHTLLAPELQRPIDVHAAAAAVGLGSRRVRQLRAEAAAFATRIGPPPTLIAVLAALTDGPARTAAEAAAVLHDAGLTSQPVHPACVLAVADLHGMPVDVSLQTAPDPRQDLVIPLRCRRDLRSWCDELQRAVDSRTVCPLSYPDPALASPDATRLLAEAEHLHIHDEPAGGARQGSWVWSRAHPRRLEGVVGTTSRRLLAVRPRTIEDLHDALVQAVDRLPPSLRRGAIAPPPNVLSAWLLDRSAAGGPLHKVADGRWTYSGQRSQLDDRLLTELNDAGGTATTAQLRRRLLQAGYSPGAANALVARSPVLRRVTRGRYTLR